MKNKERILKMVVLAMLFALSIILQAIATMVPAVSTYSLPLGLIPVAVAAIIYGPLSGALVGALWGAYINIFDPSCQTFYNWPDLNPALAIFYTILCVTGRGAIDGLFVGLVYKLCNFIVKKITKDKGEDVIAIGENIATFISSGIMCIFNALVFYSAIAIFFAFKFPALNAFFSVNLGLAVLLTVIIAPILSRVIIISKRVFNTDKKDNSKEEEYSQSNVFEDLNK